MKIQEVLYGCCLFLFGAVSQANVHSTRVVSHGEKALRNLDFEEGATVLLIGDESHPESEPQLAAHLQVTRIMLKAPYDNQRFKAQLQEQPKVDRIVFLSKLNWFVDQHMTLDLLRDQLLPSGKALVLTYSGVDPYWRLFQSAQRDAHTCKDASPIDSRLELADFSAWIRSQTYAELVLLKYERHVARYSNTNVLLDYFGGFARKLFPKADDADLARFGRKLSEKAQLKFSNQTSSIEIPFETYVVVFSKK